MEKIAQALDACHDRMLTLIENDSNKLEEQIKYWTEQKVEMLLFFAARQKGIYRIGYHTVPTAKVAEAKAKQAIMMEMMLKSLQQSQFAEEPWTLADTSYEMWDIPPKCCWKKKGQCIEVWFDGDSSKAVPYTHWQEIYSQDAEGNWHKLAGEVDYFGLSHEDPVLGRVYHVIFGHEANKYGNAKSWCVKTNSGHLLTPNRSERDSRSPSNPSSEQPTAPASRETEQEEERRYVSPQRCPEEGPVSRPPESPWRPSSPHCDILRSGGWSTLHSKGQRGRGRGRGYRHGRRNYTSPFRNPGETAGGFKEANGTPRKRSGQPTFAPGQHPFLMFHGPANALKCWRYRCRQKYRRFFWKFTTTFTWVDDGEKGAATVIVTFTSSAQLEAFFSEVPRPKTLTVGNGHLTHHTNGFGLI
nr:E2 early protein [Bos taurus papillomavirus 27]